MEKGRESMCGCLSHMPSAQACALTGNRTDDPLALRLALNPMSHTSHGKFCCILDHLKGSYSARFIHLLIQLCCFDLLFNVQVSKHSQF